MTRSGHPASPEGAGSELSLPPLPGRATAAPRGPLGRWLASGERLDQPHHGRAHSWYQVIWLTGVDYFSTLGYQPGIALLAAGTLAPAATALLVVVTLAGALPVYAQVARRSYAGQGSIAMLEALVPGWGGKLVVLGLLGFAATDFVITMTLSAADAAQHAAENPLLRPWLGDDRMIVTLALLALLAAVFLRGFTEAIGLAMAVAVPYILLNIVVLGRGLLEVASDPARLALWRHGFWSHGDPAAVALAVAIVFPRLALGLSGFETGVSVMPLVDGGAEDRARPGPPKGRIAATRKLLAAAALLMSVLLLASSVVTAVMVPEEAYASGGEASGRAIAWLAHQWFGHGFGSLYDLSTIAILWFAGASAMAGLLHLVPRYLPRFGMSPDWLAWRRPLVIVLFAICVVVTLVFDADVEAQGGAYATGVLVLILSGAVAVSIAMWRERRLATLYFCLVVAVFAYTLADNVIERPDGVIIASLFIAGILTVSAVSRWRRATELRVHDVAFADHASAAVWNEITGRKVCLVPLKIWGKDHIERKAAEIHRHYAVRTPLAFIHVRLLDNRSEFFSPLRLRVTRHAVHYVIEVTGAVAIANTIAYVSELIDPVNLFLGLTRRNLMAQSLRFLLWGEGETGLMVYMILLRYWDWTLEDDVRPRIFLMSE